MATKTTYTDEEIKQILHVLFLEKKKAKELEAQLEQQLKAQAMLKKELDDFKQNGGPHEGGPLDVHKLKELLNAFKKKYQKVSAELDEKGRQLAELNPALEAKAALEEENQALAKQLNALKLRLEKGMTDHQGTDRLQNELEAARLKLQTTQDELDKAVKGRASIQELLENEIARAAHLEKKLIEAEKSSEDLTQNDQAIIQQVEHLKEALSTLKANSQDRIRALEALHVEDQRLIEDLKTNLGEAEQEAHGFQTEIAGKEDLLKDHQVQIEFLKEALQREEAKVKAKQELYQAMKVRFEDADALRANYERQSLELVHKLHELEQHKETAMASHGRLAEFEKNQSEANAQIQTLKNDLELARNNILDVQSKLQAEAGKRLELEAKLKREKEISNNLENELKAAEEEKEAFLLQFDGLKSHVKDNQSEYESSKVNLKQALEELQKSEAQRRDLERKIEATHSQAEGQQQLRECLEELEHALAERQEQSLRDKQRIEKLAGLVLDKEKRIADLQHLEVSFKRAAEQKQHLESRLEAFQNELQNEAHEKALVKKECEESKQHALQLERVIQFLREKNEEIHLENKQYQEEQLKLREEIRTLEAGVQAAQGERNALSCSLEVAINEKSEAESELERLLAQFEALRNRIQVLQKELELNSEAKSVLQQKFDAANERGVQLERKLQDKERHLAAYEKELGLIKQTLMRGLREAKEIESNYQEAVKDKAATLAKLLQAQNQIEKQRSQIDFLQEQLGGACQLAETAQKKIEQLKYQVEEEVARHQEFHEELRVKDRQIKGLEIQLAELKGECTRLGQEMQNGLQAVQDRESSLSQAQQHFAKKVKEAAILEDQCEQQKKLIQDQHQTLNQNKIKIAELQTSVDIQSQQQKQLQEQLQDTIRSSEVQLAKWEQKYFEIYDKWQNAEGKIRELEKIEEKQKHLQGLLANLGTFIGTPSTQAVEPPPREAPKPAPKPAPKAAAEEPPKPQTEAPVQPQKPYQNLFNMPKSPGRPRQNFLE